MNVALFGGSFNPPHVCHVLAATWVLTTRDVDHVWFMPTFRHAFGKELVSFETRCEMVELAIGVLGERASVSRVEAELGGVSRTIDTLEHLEATFPEHTFSIVIGSDILLEAEQWKKFDELRRRAEFHVIGRAGVDTPQEIVIELPDISSTALRERLADGDTAYARERVPGAVVDLIESRGLYRE